MPYGDSGQADEENGVQRSVRLFAELQRLRFGAQSAEGVGSLHQGGSNPVFCNYLVSF